MTLSREMTFKAGDVLNEKWIILEFIGKGGMGEVYRAHQVRLKRDAAIKVVLREWLEAIDEGDEEAGNLVHRFRREVQAMAHIRHPNVLQIYDHDSITVDKSNEAAPIEYFAMEYIPGGSMRETMSEQGFYPEEDSVKSWIKTYFMPALAGVKALHEIGIVHRDLKPENILIDNGIPKITDFGLASSSRLKPITQSMDIKGSPQYMSPEHFFDFKRADQRADIYSLGKILFEVIDGKITSKTIPFKNAKLAKTETPFFQELDKIIRKATAENKEERIASVGELSSQLEKAVQEVQKPKTQATEAKPLSFFSRPKWIWSGVAVAVLSVLLMSVWHLMGEPGLILIKEGINERITGKTEIIEDTFFAEYSGKQYLISGGKFVVPGFAAGDGTRAVEVDPFYMDAFFVTNQQFVDFLNQNLFRISIEKDVVKGDGANWLILGEVLAGYEPIVYRNEKFRISDPVYASRPVLRITGYGALAFATFFGRRLPTEVELFYAMVKGRGNSQLETGESFDRSAEMGMMEHSNKKMDHRPTGEKTSPAPFRDGNASDEPNLPILSFPAAAYAPNKLGIRGLKEGIGEWVLKSLIDTSHDQTKINLYAVVGGVEGAPEEGSLLPEVVSRLPWEGFEEIGFRTAKDATYEDSVKKTRK